MIFVIQVISCTLQLTIVLHQAYIRRCTIVYCVRDREITVSIVIIRQGGKAMGHGEHKGNARGLVCLKPLKPYNALTLYIDIIVVRL